ncbi:MAG: hypothetical protein HGA90_00390 [Alphaproteobacteria bacterium]|nr:hypothetical protein [Alphaproteobacteria bacterium]
MREEPNLSIEGGVSVENEMPKPDENGVTLLQFGLYSKFEVKGLTKEQLGRLWEVHEEFAGELSDLLDKFQDAARDYCVYGSNLIRGSGKREGKVKVKVFVAELE